MAQYRTYRRNKDGELIDASDRLMRAMDLVALSGPLIAEPGDVGIDAAQEDWAEEGKNALTGY